jgi:uncharacterized membrane protein
MKFYQLKYQVREALKNGRENTQRLIACGPSKCVRLALAVAFGLLAVVALVTLALAALALLVPVAVVVIALGGLALVSWPFSVPSKA